MAEFVSDVAQCVEWIEELTHVQVSLLDPIRTRILKFYLQYQPVRFEQLGVLFTDTNVILLEGGTLCAWERYVIGYGVHFKKQTK